MTTWKLVSGIISIVLSAIVLFQSCAAGIGGALHEMGGGKESFAGSAGFLMALMMLIGGIVSITTRNSQTNGGNKAIMALYGIGFITSLCSLGGIFSDLIIWGIWCAVNVVSAFLDMRKKDATAAQDFTQNIMSASQTALNKVAEASAKASATISSAAKEAEKRATEAKAMVTCPNCGANIGKGKKFCPECGTAIKQANICPSCGAEIESGKKFCPECGASINSTSMNEKRICPNCGAEVAEGKKFCGKCGTKL